MTKVLSRPLQVSCCQQNLKEDSFNSLPFAIFLSSANAARSLVKNTLYSMTISADGCSRYTTKYNKTIKCVARLNNSKPYRTNK